MIRLGEFIYQLHTYLSILLLYRCQMSNLIIFWYIEEKIYGFVSLPRHNHASDSAANSTDTNYYSV